MHLTTSLYAGGFELSVHLVAIVVQCFSTWTLLLLQEENACLWDLNLTHWGWVTHKCISKLTSIGSDNGLLPGRCQAIIWFNAGILLIGPFKTNFSEIFMEIQTSSLRKWIWKCFWKMVSIFVSVSMLVGLDLFNDDTRPSGHISRPTSLNVSWLIWCMALCLLHDTWVFTFSGSTKFNVRALQSLCCYILCLSETIHNPFIIGKPAFKISILVQ